MLVRGKYCLLVWNIENILTYKRSDKVHDNLEAVTENVQSCLKDLLIIHG